jgi:hypothetical protein
MLEGGAEDVGAKHFLRDAHSTLIHLALSYFSPLSSLFFTIENNVTNVTDIDAEGGAEDVGAKHFFYVMLTPPSYT